MWPGVWQGAAGPLLWPDCHPAGLSPHFERTMSVGLNARAAGCMQQPNQTKPAYFLLQLPTKQLGSRAGRSAFPH